MCLGFASGGFSGSTYPNSQIPLGEVIRATHTPTAGTPITYKVRWYNTPGDEYFSARFDYPMTLTISDTEGGRSLTFAGWPSLSAYAGWQVHVNAAGTGFVLTPP